MKQLLLIPVLLFSAFSVTAQCMFFVQPTVTKVTSDTTVNNASGEYWVCLGKTLTVVSSTGSTYYMEDFSVLNVAATTGDQAILKPACTINNSSSGTITVTADMTSVTLNNTGSGTIVQQTDCPPGNFIDPFAPGVNFGYGGTAFYGQCYVIPLGLENTGRLRFSVFPNPASGATLSLDSEIAVSVASITDIRGKTVGVFDRPEETLPIAGLATGTYFLQAVLENGDTRTVRFSVQ